MFKHDVAPEILLVDSRAAFILGFSEIQAELTNLPSLPNFLPNLPILPNCVKIKKPLKVFKFKFSDFISF